MLRFLFIVLSTMSMLVLANPVTHTNYRLYVKEVYQDRNDSEFGTFYCGCKWVWRENDHRDTGSITDLTSCGYSIRAQPIRANRGEFEHIYPASSMGRDRPCWAEGGRANCLRVDMEYRAMFSDLHNLTLAVGEINADRMNFDFTDELDVDYRHGQCDFKVSFPEGLVVPRLEVRGMIARTYFYMADRYNLSIDESHEARLVAWNRNYPVSEWELERNRRIKAIMGHGNPFVTGEKEWNPPPQNQCQCPCQTYTSPSSNEKTLTFTTSSIPDDSILISSSVTF